MKYVKYIFIAALLTTAGACTGDFEDYNSNPNKLTQGSITPISLLEPLIYNSSNSYSSYMLDIANEISQVTVAKSSPRQEHRYNLDNGNFEAIWNLGFKWAANANHMYELAVDQNQPNFQAIGLTLKVYNMAILTDMFGSIAYREALKGNQGIVRPHIDSQQEVYQAMMEDLERANGLYDVATKIEDPTKDGIYGGDMSQWKKFTNTLHLRLLMRVSGRNTAFTPSVGERINKIISDPATYPVFESSSDNATVKFSGAAEYYKTHFNKATFPDDKSLSSDHHISSQFLGMIYDEASGFEDPRMRIWIKPRYTDQAIRPMDGALSGCSVKYNDNSTHSDKEPYLHYETLVGDVKVNHLLDYDELLFIKAEAAMKGWISGSAQAYYEAAVTASCQKWGAYGGDAAYPALLNGKVVFKPVEITQKDIVALLANDRVKWDDTEQRLAEQKWLSLFWTVGFQMYHEMRRTGYPECKTGKGTQELNRTSGKFIARYAYPLIAIANNRANYEAAFVAQGGSLGNNDMIFPVWWSGQAVAQDTGTPWEHTFRKNITAEEN
ncbi:MAG: SusD/RagB family nutrient-binding outer membrane lipoprotein [Alistipes sp.]